MDERRLRLLAVACSAAGLILLYFSSLALEAASAPVTLSSLTLDKAGTTVKACGNTSGLRTSKGHVFFSLADASGSIDVVVFNSTAAKTGVPAGGSICVLGQLDEYPPGSGRPEIVVRKMII